MLLICGYIIYKSLKFKPSKIEDLPKECYYHIDKEKIPKELYLEIRKHINIIKNTIENREYKDIKDKYGRAYVTCSEPFNNVLIAMKHIGIAKSWGEYYHIDIGENSLNNFQSISINESIANDITKYLNENLVDIFYSKSYID